jgi:hypothetical protein
MFGKYAIFLCVFGVDVCKLIFICAGGGGCEG